MVTSGEKSEIPTAFLDYTLNLYVIPGVKLKAV